MDWESRGILENIITVEESHADALVLHLGAILKPMPASKCSDSVARYHAMPFYLFLLSWIWNAVLQERPLSWSEALPMATTTALTLRVFEDEFPRIDLPETRVCPRAEGMANVYEEAVI